MKPKLTSDNPRVVRIRFSAKVAPVVRENVWHESQIFMDRKNGQVLLTMLVDESPELIQWIMSFGASAYVHKPYHLRLRIVSEAQQILLLHVKKSQEQAA